MSLSQKTISFKALQRCRTTIEDFACTYFPLHGLDPTQTLFKYLDIFLFVEASIYQMDEENEEICGQLTEMADPHANIQHTFQDYDVLLHLLMYVWWDTGESVLLEVLEQQQLLTERVRAELQAGMRYWQQERQVCAELAQLRPGHPLKLTLTDVLTTHELKSFDYRVMHLMLHGLLKQPYNEALLEFMQVDEMLIDIGDDLTDYEDDVMANSFNIFRGYIYLHGRDAPIKLAERISQLEAKRSQLLVQLPADIQKLVLRRQADAAVEEGADKWAFPDVILDEVEYRQEIRQLEAGGVP